MKTYQKIIIAMLVIAISPVAIAQSESDEQLKLSALEALMNAPADRALPIVTKVLQGSGSNALKSRALFVLSQIDHEDANQLLIETAKSGDAELRHEAVRMIGIGGDETTLAGLAEIYASGDESTRDAVLEAYLIADDSDAVFRIASNAQDPDDFDRAVEMLAAMGAHDKLRELRASAGMSESLIDAYAIAGDVETLRELALDDSNPEMQKHAIQGLGIAGDDDVGETLMAIYRDAASDDIREAALEGMMIADHDEGVLELFRQSQDADEKKQLLEMLVVMDSDAVWDIIDQTLEGN